MECLQIEIEEWRQFQEGLEVLRPRHVPVDDDKPAVHLNSLSIGPTRLFALLRAWQWQITFLRIWQRAGAAYSMQGPAVSLLELL
jgi:hypothetical protein